MRENVKNFVEMIADGKDVMIAANETGVIEMNTHDLLSEMSIVLGGKQFANTLKSAIGRFANWAEVSQALLRSKKSLENMLGSIKELDTSLKDMDNNTVDIIKMETDIILRDKEGNIINVETPQPEVYEEKWW